MNEDSNFASIVHLNGPDFQTLPEASAPAGADDGCWLRAYLLPGARRWSGDFVEEAALDGQIHQRVGIAEHRRGPGVPGWRPSRAQGNGSPAGEPGRAAPCRRPVGGVEPGGPHLGLARREDDRRRQVTGSLAHLPWAMAHLESTATLPNVTLALLSCWNQAATRSYVFNVTTSIKYRYAASVTYGFCCRTGWDRRGLPGRKE